MGGNKENMKQAMKELLGLVGIGAEGEQESGETAPRSQERPAVKAKPRGAEPQVTVEPTPAPAGREAPQTSAGEKAPAPEEAPPVQPAEEPEAPVFREPVQTPPIRRDVEQTPGTVEPAVPRYEAPHHEPPAQSARPETHYEPPAQSARPETHYEPPAQSARPETRYQPPVQTPPRTDREVDLAAEQREVAATVEKGFFGGLFGRRDRTREQERQLEQERLREQERKREQERMREQELSRIREAEIAREREAARLIDDSLFPFGIPKEDPAAAQPAAPAYNPNLTVVSAGTSLFGDIRSEGEVEIHGKLKGNLEATGNVCITGKVLGDVKGDSVELIGCAVQGNITASATVKIDQGTIVVGDIIAADLETDGKIKGSVQVEQSASFYPNAVLAGNVTASMVSMSRGAKIQGAVRISEDSETNALFGDKLEI